MLHIVVIVLAVFHLSKELLQMYRLVRKLYINIYTLHINIIIIIISIFSVIIIIVNILIQHQRGGSSIVLRRGCTIFRMGDYYVHK